MSRRLHSFITGPLYIILTVDVLFFLPVVNERLADANGPWHPWIVMLLLFIFVIWLTLFLQVNFPNKPYGRYICNFLIATSTASVFVLLFPRWVLYVGTESEEPYWASGFWAGSGSLIDVGNDWVDLDYSFLFLPPWFGAKVDKSLLAVELSLILVGGLGAIIAFLCEKSVKKST